MNGNIHIGNILHWLQLKWYHTLAKGQIEIEILIKHLCAVSICSLPFASFHSSMLSLTCHNVNIPTGCIPQLAQTYHLVGGLDHSNNQRFFKLLLFKKTFNKKKFILLFYMSLFVVSVQIHQHLGLWWLLYFVHSVLCTLLLGLLLAGRNKQTLKKRSHHSNLHLLVTVQINVCGMKIYVLKNFLNQNINWFNNKRINAGKLKMNLHSLFKC